jgi:hypothetical protein
MTLTATPYLTISSSADMAKTGCPWPRAWDKPVTPYTSNFRLHMTVSFQLPMTASIPPLTSQMLPFSIDLIGLGSGGTGRRRCALRQLPSSHGLSLQGPATVQVGEPLNWSLPVKF